MDYNNLHLAGFISSFVALMSAFLILIGTTSLSGDRLVRLHDIIVVSRDIIGSGLCVACNTTLLVNGYIYVSVTTDGSCNPALSPEISGIDVCAPIGRPDDADIGCGSLAMAIVVLSLGCVGPMCACVSITVCSVLAWYHAHRYKMGGTYA